jgi:hypothetical protein
MSGDIPPLTLHAFMAWTGATLPFTISNYFICHLALITGTVSDPASKGCAYKKCTHS